MQKTSKFLIGAGVAAAVAGGVMAFLSHPRGKKLAKDGKKYLAEITNQVVKRSEKIANISKAAYERIVDDVVEQYEAQKEMNSEAAKELATQLKKEWNAVKRELKKK